MIGTEDTPYTMSTQVTTKYCLQLISGQMIQKE